jgi:hypothetical protein
MFSRCSARPALAEGITAARLGIVAIMILLFLVFSLSFLRNPRRCFLPTAQAGMAKDGQRFTDQESQDPAAESAFALKAVPISGRFEPAALYCPFSHFGPT